MGTRLGEDQPKAFVDLGGTTILERSVDSALRSSVFSRVIVVVPEDMVEHARELVPEAEVVAGGAERSDSVRAGLAVIGSAERVLIHDAARALTPPDLFVRVDDELRNGATAVVPVLPVVDTLKRVDTVDHEVIETVDRAKLRAVQTPQGFTHTALQLAHAESGDATDDAGLVEALGSRVQTVPGDQYAFKITTAFDLRIARLLLADEATS